MYHAEHLAPGEHTQLTPDSGGHRALLTEPLQLWANHGLQSVTKRLFHPTQ